MPLIYHGTRPPLARVLRWVALIAGKAKGYCLKLERAALDFTCFEKIQEKTYRLPEIELDAAPQLTSVTEYGLEKSGLRFPSKDTTEEAYVKNGKRFVQSLTTIRYNDYKFFTVETEVHY